MLPVNIEASLEITSPNFSIALEFIPWYVLYNAEGDLRYQLPIFIYFPLCSQIKRVTSELQKNKNCSTDDTVSNLLEP